MMIACYNGQDRAADLVIFHWRASGASDLTVSDDGSQAHQFLKVNAVPEVRSWYLSPKRTETRVQCTAGVVRFESGSLVCQHVSECKLVPSAHLIKWKLLPNSSNSSGPCSNKIWECWLKCRRITYEFCDRRHQVCCEYVYGAPACDSHQVRISNGILKSDSVHSWLIQFPYR